MGLFSGGLLSSIFGKKPKVPEFKPVSMDEQQVSSIAGNLAALPKAKELATGQQAADQAALEQGLIRAIPGYEGLVTGQRDVAADFLAARVPVDVANRIADAAAAQGLASGTVGSRASKYAGLRNLGLTSLDMQTRGVGMARDLIAQQSTYGMAKPISVASMFFTPQQRLAHATSERSMQFQRDWLSAKTAAAPSPVVAGLRDMTMFGVGMAGGYGAFAAGAAKNVGAAAGFMGGLPGRIGGLFGGGGGGVAPAQPNPFMLGGQHGLNPFVAPGQWMQPLAPPVADFGWGGGASGLKQEENLLFRDLSM